MNDRSWARWRPRPCEVAGLVLGLAAGAAFLAGGNVLDAIVASVLIAASGIFMSRGRSELAIIGTDRQDERQASVSREATSVAYVAVIVVALVGWLDEAAHGRGGPYGTILAVGGGAQMVSTLLLSRRRRARFTPSRK